jgi:GDP/UDP-N,N'-diacetylbacillosamine 2-epimerase (hydrolysing)
VIEPRKIYFLTAARSEYDLLSPVIHALSGAQDVRAEVIATAAHLSPFHGMGVEQIRSDGFELAGTIESLLSSESWVGRSLSFAHLLEGLTHLLSAKRPDILFIAGDREEALAGAIVANFLGIHVAHVHGGDRCYASEIDEVFRPAISKLAHFHFTATDGHRERLIRMGECPELIWTTGGTGLDRLRTEADISDEELSREMGIDVRKPFFLLIQHPSSMVATDRGSEMAGLLRGLLSLECPVLCSYPNFDPGNMPIRQAIDEAKAEHNNLIVYHNLPRSKFVALYRRCAAIVGNSSSIVLESSFLRVPGVLLGPRQDLRETAPNVLRAGLSEAEVRAVCHRVLNDAEFQQQVKSCPSPYGDGYAASRIAKILQEVELDRSLLLKTITY